MLKDVRGLPLTAASAEAVAHFDATVAAYCGLRSDTGDHLKNTLAADSKFIMAHLLRGYFMMLFGKRDHVARAEQSLASARAALAELGASERERHHLEALTAWVRGRLDEAVARWETILLDHPRDLVAFKLAQYATFYRGDSQGMCSSTARVLYAWDESVPGYGFVLGCHAFGLEESGDYAAAERVGRRAIDINRADVWAAHAVAHVFEMQNRTREGLDWIASLDREWGSINNFVFHIRWHRCLFYLERQDYDKVLELYDREVRAESTDEYLDITNGVALLWRLEQEGVDVGGRWAELHERSAAHIDDHMLVFADVHYAIALTAAGDGESPGRWQQSSLRYSAAAGETQAGVMADVGLTLGEAAIAHRRREYARVIELLLPVRSMIRRIGGSHAQRDLFEQMLVDAALKASRPNLARALLSERLTQRPHNLWGWKHVARAGKALDDAATVAAAEGEVRRLLAS